MDAVSFVATVILITASGALAPGPLFFATLSHGARSGAKSGLMFSIAHTLIEFTLVLLLAFGLLTVANEPIVKIVFGVAGGIALLVFGIMQICHSLRFSAGETGSKETAKRKLLLTGLAFTGLNPFFIAWWLTVGANLILLGFEFGALAGVVLMFLSHIWIDYAWLVSTAHFAKVGMNLVGFKWYRVLMAVFGMVLIYFGLTFLIDSIRL